MSCSRGCNMAAARSCGTRSAASSTSSRSSAPAPVARWAGGSFSEVNSPESFKGLRYRMGGSGAEVLRRMGATVVTLPGGEIMPALQSGAIHASEWVGPWLDMAIGLHKAAGFYYYPAFHEPGSGFSVGINKGVWESFDPSDRRVFESVAAGEYARSLAEFNTNNALSLRKLRDEGAVKIRKFDNSLLKALLEISKDVVAEIGSGDDAFQKNLRELRAVSKLDHGLERHRRTRFLQRARACLILEECGHAATGYSGWRGISGSGRQLELSRARNRTGSPTIENGNRLARRYAGPPRQRGASGADDRHCDSRPHQNRSFSVGRVGACHSKPSMP